MLLTLVFSTPGLVLVALHQLAQTLHPGIGLLPGTTCIIEVVLVPDQALTLLGHGRFQLPEKTLVIDQPATIDPLPAAVDPLQLVILAKALQLGQLGLGRGHLLLKMAKTLSCLALGLFGHVHHRRQARGTSGLRHGLSTCRGRENRPQLLAALRHAHVLAQALTQELNQLRLQRNGQVGLRITAGHIGTHADQVAAL